MTPALVRRSTAAFLVGIALAVALTSCSGEESAAGPGVADVGFARDMRVHHMQAVEMAGMVRLGTEDLGIRQLATDIELTQQSQVGQMRGWLEVWDEPLTSMDAPMSWMADEHGADHGADHGGGLMPGMATREEMQELGELDGSERDALFLELMIRHHRGGVEMAEAALDRADDEDVLRLARTVLTTQRSEIAAMEDLLREIS